MKDLYIGNDPFRKKVYLTKEDLQTHVHISGLSRMGKTRLIEHLLREFIISRIPFVLIDPHGELYRSLLHWLAYIRIPRPILLFDPSYQKRIVGFNPFQTTYTDDARIATKVDRMVTATMRVWGLPSTDNFGNIERWLSNIYYVILEQSLTVADIPTFTMWNNQAARDKILNLVKNEAVRTELKDFYDVSKGQLRRDIITTRNKLRRFNHPQTQRIMSLKTNNIDLGRFIEGQQTLLVNLQASPDDLTGFENNRTIGALLLAEIWELYMKRTSSKELCLVIDEFPTLPSLDLEKMLEQTGKYGLHLFLAHQQEGQVRKAGMTGAIENAQVKIAFSTEENPRPKRHFILRRADHSLVEVETPEVRPFRMLPPRLYGLIESLTKDFLTTEEVDRLLATPQNGNTPSEPAFDEGYEIKWKTEQPTLSTTPTK